MLDLCSVDPGSTRFRAAEFLSVLNAFLIWYLFQQYKPRLGAGEVKIQALGSIGNKLFHPFRILIGLWVTSHAQTGSYLR